MGKKTKKQAKSGGSNAAHAKQPLAALYNLEAGTTRGDAVRSVLDAQGVRVRTVSADELGNPVGAIMGLPGFKKTTLPYEGVAPTCEFMLIDNISSAQLSTLLAAMRDADASVGCKAQVTQHNRLWPFATLVENVSREHEAMQQAAR